MGDRFKIDTRGIKVTEDGETLTGKRRKQVLIPIYDVPYNNYGTNNTNGLWDGPSITMDEITSGATYMLGGGDVKFKYAACFRTSNSASMSHAWLQSLNESGAVLMDNLTRISGTSTSRSNKKLVDTNASFQTDGVQAGDTVYNTTNPASTTVVSVDSETQLTLTVHIFAVNGGGEDWYIDVAEPVTTEWPVTPDIFSTDDIGDYISLWPGYGNYEVIQITGYTSGVTSDILGVKRGQQDTLNSSKDTDSILYLQGKLGYLSATTETFAWQESEDLDLIDGGTYVHMDRSSTSDNFLYIQHIAIIAYLEGK